MPRVLILAYGNPLRCDDGVAWQAAEALDGKFRRPEVEIRCLHQLTPELAESVSPAGCVIFVDAARAAHIEYAGQVQVAELHSEAEDAGPSTQFSHSLSPNSLLCSALHLYGVAPRAFCVTLTGSNFDHGESLSPAVAAALPDLVSRLESLIQAALG